MYYISVLGKYPNKCSCACFGYDYQSDSSKYLAIIACRRALALNALFFIAYHIVENFEGGQFCNFKATHENQACHIHLHTIGLTFCKSEILSIPTNLWKFSPGFPIIQYGYEGDGISCVHVSVPEGMIIVTTLCSSNSCYTCAGAYIKLLTWVHVRVLTPVVLPYLTDSQ